MPTYVCVDPFAFFFFNDTATTEIYTLSLHDALPIYIFCNHMRSQQPRPVSATKRIVLRSPRRALTDRKSTRLNSSHQIISYAVFCLKKKNESCRDQMRESDRRQEQRSSEECHGTPRG